MDYFFCDDETNEFKISNSSEQQDDDRGAEIEGADEQELIECKSR